MTAWYDYQMSETESKKLDNIEKLVEVIAGSVAGLNTKVDGLTVKVDVLTSRVDVLTTRVDVLTTRVDDLTTRVDNLTTKVDQLGDDLSSFKQETREDFDKVNGRLDNLEESVNSIVKEYHPRIIGLEERVFGTSTLAEA